MNSYDINEILTDIKSDRKKKVILDTDAFNEADDQYAISYLLLSQDKVDIVGFTAAPFKNTKSTSPGDGMIKSWHELKHVIKLVGASPDIPVLKGSNNFLKDEFTYEESEAADFIIEQAKKSDERIYVLAIGAITNVASALLKCPDIREKIVVAWLGTNIGEKHQIGEFNSYQDVAAVSALFDSGAPILLLPLEGSTYILGLSGAEYIANIKGRNRLCDYLFELVLKDKGGMDFEFKGLVDIGCVAALVLHDCMDFNIGPAPKVISERDLAYDEARHPIITTGKVKRDMIFADVYKKLWSVKDTE